MWRADRSEIFYVDVTEGKMMAMPVETGGDFFRPGTPRALFQTRGARFDATSPPTASAS